MDNAKNMIRSVATIAKKGMGKVAYASHELADIVKDEVSIQKRETDKRAKEQDMVEDAKERVGEAAPSNFQLLYTSKDGRFCLFETREGNLVSADSSKFA